VLGGRNLRKTRHGHDIAGLHDNEARARRNLDLANGNLKAARRTGQVLVVREAELGLRHADRIGAEAEFFQALCLLFRLGREHHAVAAIHLAHNLVELFLEAVAVLIGKAEVVLRRVLAETHDLTRKRLAAFAALGPDLGEHDIDTEFLALVRDAAKLLLGVKREAVNRDHGRKTEDLRHVLDMLQKVRKPLLQCFDIRRVELCLIDAAVVLQCAHSCDNDRAARAQPRPDLEAVGDSLLITPLDMAAGLWALHVHVPDIDPARELIMGYGQWSDERISSLADGRHADHACGAEGSA